MSREVVGVFPFIPERLWFVRARTRYVESLHGHHCVSVSADMCIIP